ACHHGYQYAGGHGWAAAGCGNQRKVAADPSDSRHGVYTAETDRTAFGKLVCAETLRPEGYPYGGGTFPIAETTFLSSSSNALAEKLRNSGSDARPLIEAYR